VLVNIYEWCVLMCVCARARVCVCVCAISVCVCVCVEWWCVFMCAICARDHSCVMFVCVLCVCVCVCVVWWCVFMCAICARDHSCVMFVCVLCVCVCVCGGGVCSCVLYVRDVFLCMMRTHFCLKAGSQLVCLFFLLLSFPFLFFCLLYFFTLALSVCVYM
jgi:hypothetical protein